MKRRFLLIGNALCFIFLGCSKILVNGFEPYKLGSEVSFDTIHILSAEEYEPGVIKEKGRFSHELFFGELDFQFRKIYYGYDNDRPIINEVQYSIASDDAARGMSCLKKYYYLVAKEKTGSRTIYTFSDKLTDNIVKAEKDTDGILLIRYISDKQSENNISADLKHDSIITGTNGFLLYMTHKDALINARKQDLKISKQQQRDGILTIWLNPTGEKISYGPEAYWGDLSLNSRIDNPWHGDKDMICLIFIKDESDAYRLVAYYKKVLWEHDYFHTFLKPLVDKYGLLQIKTEGDGDKERKRYFYHSSQNTNYLEVFINEMEFKKLFSWERFIDNTSDDLDNTSRVLYIKYSIADDEINLAKQRYSDAKKVTENSERKTFVEGL